jgi:hypothetical protein
MHKGKQQGKQGKKSYYYLHIQDFIKADFIGLGSVKIKFKVIRMQIALNKNVSAPKPLKTVQSRRKLPSKISFAEREKPIFALSREYHLLLEYPDQIKQ